MPSADTTTRISTTSSSISSKAFSISLPSSKLKSVPQTTLQPLKSKKRPHSSLVDSDSENENTSHRPQLISSFDHAAGGAISINGPEKTKALLVIQGLKNRNWREESRKKRGKNLLPAEIQAASSTQDFVNPDAVEEINVPQEFGLSLKKTEVRDCDGDATTIEAQVLNKVLGTETTTVVAKTEDEEAIDALIGNDHRTSTLVLPAVGGDQEPGGTANSRFSYITLNEDESFRSDVASRPDSATLEDYANIPVEEFGAALLRGMGWKEGDIVGKRKDQIIKAKTVERRPALLGIGAKEVPGGIGEELGAWGKPVRGKRKVHNSYNPVLLRNSKTGEMLTEEELEAKREGKRKEEADWRERRDRNLAVDEAKKNERGKKEKDREHRHGSRRERSRSTERSYRSASKRERSRSAERSRQPSVASKREPSRSPDRKRRVSSRRQRSRSTERNHSSRRRDHDDYQRRDRREKAGEYRSRDRRKEDEEGKRGYRDGWGEREDGDGRRSRRDDGP